MTLSVIIFETNQHKSWQKAINSKEIQTLNLLAFITIYWAVTLNPTGISVLECTHQSLHCHSNALIQIINNMRCVLCVFYIWCKAMMHQNHWYNHSLLFHKSSSNNNSFILLHRLHSLPQHPTTSLYFLHCSGWFNIIFSINHYSPSFNPSNLQ